MSSTKFVNTTSRGIKKAEASDPIKNKSDIANIKKYLLQRNRYRDYCLFVVGINIGLRVSDLMTLKVKDVKEKDYCEIYEIKTGKKRTFEFNNSCKDAIELYLNNREIESEEEFLFISTKTKIALNTKSVHKIIKTLCRNLNLRGNYGSHSLRKTFAYNIYVSNALTNPMTLVLLQRMLNHSTADYTLRYIGIDDESIRNTYLNLNL